MKFRTDPLPIHRIVSVGGQHEAPIEDPAPTSVRGATLGDRPIWLYGCVPKFGERLCADFSIPAARRATDPLTARSLRDGLVIVSTLPNIEKHSCIVQIAGLEEHAFHHFPEVRICHVSSDDARHWREVDEYHSEVRAAGYSLRGADAVSSLAFRMVFGVGVRGSARVAHGLFALKEGVFLASEIPADQYKPPAVSQFLHRLVDALGASD